MKTRNINVYTFAELSPEVKGQVRDHYEIILGGSCWDVGYEYISSLKALAQFFDGQIRNYNLDWSGSSHSYVEFDMPEMEEKEILRRIKELGSYNKHTLKGKGDCKLTGVCYDEDAIDGFRRAFIKNGEQNLESLMQEAYKTWMDAAKSEYASYFSDEGFSEYFEGRGFEFMADGTRLKK
jgi:hypothetical protein